MCLAGGIVIPFIGQTQRKMVTKFASVLWKTLSIYAYICVIAWAAQKELAYVALSKPYSTACPGQVGDNHTCVYEVKTTRFSSDTVRKAVQVTTEVAVRVREKARVSVGVSHTKEHTVVNTYSVDSRSYIVIPAGYRFCSFSKVVSKKDYLAETGFKWSCKLPTFVQTNMISGRCTNLAQCESKSPCSTTHSRQTRQRSEINCGSASAVAMLLALCMIVSGKLANCAANNQQNALSKMKP